METKDDLIENETESVEKAPVWTIHPTSFRNSSDSDSNSDSEEEYEEEVEDESLKNYDRRSLKEKMSNTFNIEIHAPSTNTVTKVGSFFPDNERSGDGFSTISGVNRSLQESNLPFNSGKVYYVDVIDREYFDKTYLIRFKPDLDKIVASCKREAGDSPFAVIYGFMHQEDFIQGQRELSTANFKLVIKNKENTSGAFILSSLSQEEMYSEYESMSYTVPEQKNTTENGTFQSLGEVYAYLAVQNANSVAVKYQINILKKGLVVRHKTEREINAEINSSLEDIKTNAKKPQNIVEFIRKSEYDFSVPRTLLTVLLGGVTTTLVVLGGLSVGNIYDFADVMFKFLPWDPVISIFVAAGIGCLLTVFAAYATYRSIEHKEFSVLPDNPLNDYDTKDDISLGIQSQPGLHPSPLSQHQPGFHSYY